MRASIILPLGLALIAPLSAQARPKTPAGASAEARLRTDVTFLASPKLKGRGNGSPELQQAAAFIVKRQKALGLKPVVQTFGFPASLQVEAAKATFIQGDERIEWTRGKDFEPLGLSGDSLPQPHALVFLGYGVKTQGGLLDFVHREIEIECLPSLIPTSIPVNVEALKVGDSIRFEQLTLASTLKIVGEAHEVICAIHGKPAEEVAAEAAAAAAAEPEVVGTKGKKDKK